MSPEDVPKHAEASGAKERRARRLRHRSSKRTETRDLDRDIPGYSPDSRPDQKSKPGGVKGVKSSEPSDTFDVEATGDSPAPDPVAVMERRLMIGLILVLGIWVVTNAV